MRGFESYLRRLEGGSVLPRLLLKLGWVRSVREDAGSRPSERLDRLCGAGGVNAGSPSSAGIAASSEGSARVAGGRET